MKRSNVLIKVFCILMTFSMFTYTVMAFSNEVKIEENIIGTASVQLNFNNGETIFNEEDIIAPGQTLIKEFTISNESTVEVWYELMLKNVKGNLASFLGVDLYKEDQLVYSGMMSDLEKKSFIDDDSLNVKEVANFKIYIRLTDDIELSDLVQEVQFDFVAQAVQKKNNPSKEF